MNTFQPLGCGFGQSHLPPATSTANDSGTTDMTKHDVAITDKIVRLLGEAGGELAGAELRDQLGADEADRRTAISALRKAGRISSEGAPRSVVYRLEDGTKAPEAGHRIPNPKKPTKEKKAKKTGKAKPAKTAVAAIDKHQQLVIDRPAPIDRHPVTLSVALDVTVVEDLQPIPRQHLRRVLALALSCPGDISNSDREALCAIAESAR